MISIRQHSSLYPDLTSKVSMSKDIHNEGTLDEVISLRFWQDQFVNLKSV
jgi:hypothetical protein